jgi:hypothetical protein
LETRFHSAPTRLDRLDHASFRNLGNQQVPAAWGPPAATAVRAGLCEGDFSVTMPGGALAVRVGAAFDVTQEGPAARVFDGVWKS